MLLMAVYVLLVGVSEKLSEEVINPCPSDNFTINYTGCPDCYCQECNTTIINNYEIDNSTNENSTNNIYAIDNYIVNCSMERNINTIEAAILRIETNIKNNLTIK